MAVNTTPMSCAAFNERQLSAYNAVADESQAVHYDNQLHTNHFKFLKIKKKDEGDGAGDNT